MLNQVTEERLAALFSKCGQVSLLSWTTVNLLLWSALVSGALGASFQLLGKLKTSAFTYDLPFDLP